jgi:hypothetical protein
MVENMIIFRARSCQHLAQNPSWRTTTFLLSATVYSTYSQLRSILETVRSSATSGRAAPRRGDRHPIIVQNSHLMYRTSKLPFHYKVKNKTAHAIKYHAQQRTVKSTLNPAHTKRQKKVNSQVQDSADLASLAIGNAYKLSQTFINSVQRKTISKLMPVFMTDRHQVNLLLLLHRAFR